MQIKLTKLSISNSIMPNTISVQNSNFKRELCPLFTYPSSNSIILIKHILLKILDFSFLKDVIIACCPLPNTIVDAP